MELTLSAELQAKLSRIAQERGTNPQELAREAIERLVDYDDWFLREVEKGVAQTEGGQTLTHDDVGARLTKHLTSKLERSAGLLAVKSSASSLLASRWSR